MIPIPLLIGIVDLIKWAIPEIEKAVQSGEIPIEQQQAVKTAYADLVDHLDTKFAEPQWQIDPDEPSAPVNLGTDTSTPSAPEELPTVIVQAPPEVKVEVVPAPEAPEIPPIS